MSQTSPCAVSSVITAATLWLCGCAVTSHGAQPAQLGTPRPLSALEAVVDQPGPIEVETIVAGDWHVPLSGLLNLDDPSAQAAGLEDREEPIEIYAHALRHPQFGSFLIDSGVESALAGDRDQAAIGGLVASVAGLDALKVRLDTRTWLSRQSEPLRGVLLTHLHLDHIMGLPDVPAGTPIFTGPGEAQATSFENLFVQSTTDRELAAHAPLSEWAFGAAASAAGGASEGIAAVLDVFGDGSLWALHVPGHTPGSTAYLARSPTGPVLFTGDACHTAWGWQHGVEPGTFSSDRARSRGSLLALRALAERHPGIEVRLGHQSLKPAGLASAGARDGRGAQSRSTQGR
jgi:glyoxylase-like metal-dependent hydrolase (beta-lactamase superfamily II)